MDPRPGFSRHDLRSIEVAGAGSGDGGLGVALRGEPRAVARRDRQLRRLLVLAEKEVDVGKGPGGDGTAPMVAVPGGGDPAPGELLRQLEITGGLPRSFGRGAEDLGFASMPDEPRIGSELERPAEELVQVAPHRVRVEVDGERSCHIEVVVVPGQAPGAAQVGQLVP